MPRPASSSRVAIAETVAVGSELLIGGRSDSNSLRIAEALAELGVAVRFKTIVGDDEADIRTVLTQAVSRAGIVILTGGLGPTVDDVTREAIATATGRRLARRKEALDGMTARLSQWGRVPNEGQLRQALIPVHAAVLPNPVGSAPGFWLTWKDATIVSLPGVPSEMDAMMTASVLPLLRMQLAERLTIPPRPLTRVVFHTWGLPEADVDARLLGLVPKGVPIDLGLLASPTGVLVSLTTKATGSPSPSLLSALSEGVRSRLAEWLYAEGSETMEQVVGRLLAERKLTVATAESCTGGLIGHRLTQVPGSSAYVDRGVICYSNRAKSELLGVSPRLIKTHGAVSAQVAAAMARGMRERAGVSAGVSVTGIAGPGGGTPAKPVGLVYIGLHADDGQAITKEYRFNGDRSVVKQRSSQAALDMLRRWAVSRRLS
ncbi:MAG: competence/damage-inducible protein A [Nitrospiraceae bacterium]|nr:competence/damage-inducible protein A [Nitrospiraceae bacterium]